MEVQPYRKRFKLEFMENFLNINSKIRQAFVLLTHTLRNRINNSIFSVLNVQLFEWNIIFFLQNDVYFFRNSKIHFILDTTPFYLLCTWLHHLPQKVSLVNHGQDRTPPWPAMCGHQTMTRGRTFGWRVERRDWVQVSEGMEISIGK